MKKNENYLIDSWGYEHPNVKGPNALMFFTWDLSKTIEHAFVNATEDTLDEYIDQAQESIDQLMKKYVEIKADPASFEGQRITVHLERKSDQKGALIALQTSPELEDRIIQMQSRVQPGHS